MFKLSSNWRRRFHNRPVQKSRGCFTAYIYLWKKTHSTNNICKQRRSPKNREALNIWILICEITRQWHAASVTPCTHEINEYKQNRLPLETSSAKFSATTNFLFSLSSLHTLNKGIFHDIKRQQQKNPRGIDKSNDLWTRCTCWIKELRNPFVTKVKCPTGRASVWVKFPTVRSLTRVKCPGIARG